ATTLPPPPMVQARVAVCVSAPLVPVTVTVYAPAAAVPAASVSVEVPLPVTLAGLKLAEAPAGNPPAESATAPLKPLLGDTVITELPEPVRLAGLAPRPKSALAAQPDTLLPGKQTDNTACSSMALGATPVWPCWRSKNPAPVSVTGTSAVWKLVLTVNLASNALREAVII